jgi:DNA mismatch repair protein MutS
VHVSAAESGLGIVFLHEIQPGPASRSYGVQVARLAGMPANLVRQARATLEALEAQRVQGQAQIDLFAAPPGVTEAAPSPLEAAVAALNPDMLAPREALDTLYRLKSLESTTGRSRVDSPHSGGGGGPLQPARGTTEGKVS